MSRLHLMSLGAWCRPAYQIETFAASRDDMHALRGPFDWTITSFAALRACLTPGFDPQTVLQPGQCHVSFAGSGACSTTGLVFHHAIERSTMLAMGHDTPGAAIPPSAAFDARGDNARGRFAHTFRTLKQRADYDEPTLFVRWQRAGHPDLQYPAAFAGESDAAMRDLLARFLVHDRFHLLTLQSSTLSDRTAAFDTPLLSLTADGAMLTGHIKERKGWNGDQTANFKGDEHSWGIALQAAVDLIGA